MSGDNKLQIPGWRIEQIFNNKVLIGNWNEERRKFQCGNQDFGNSTHRNDFKKYGACVPDVKIRRAASMRNDGLEKKFIFSHHGFGYSNNLISLYDQMINNRDVKESTLPKLRTWDGDTLVWLPERSDHPLLGKPTVYGLHEKLAQKWKKERELEGVHFQSTYKSSFDEHAKEAMVFKRYATKKPLSSHFVPHTINKNLAMRNVNVNLAPEFPTIVPEKIVS